MANTVHLTLICTLCCVAIGGNYNVVANSRTVSKRRQNRRSRFTELNQRDQEFILENSRTNQPIDPETILDDTNNPYSVTESPHRHRHRHRGRSKQRQSEENTDDSNLQISVAVYKSKEQSKKSKSNIRPRTKTKSRLDKLDPDDNKRFEQSGDSDPQPSTTSFPSVTSQDEQTTQKAADHMIGAAAEKDSAQWNNDVIDNLLEEDVDLDDENPNVKTLVSTLQTQLKESVVVQRYTRSVLNVIEENQQKMSQDLSTLKDEIRILKHIQSQDRETVDALQSLVADNTWGVANMKSQQDQLHIDFKAFKQLQESHNDTIREIDEDSEMNEYKHQSYKASIHHLTNEVINIREDIIYNRQKIKHVERAMERAKKRKNPNQWQSTGNNLFDLRNGISKEKYLPLQQRPSHTSAFGSSEASGIGSRERLHSAENKDGFSGGGVSFEVLSSQLEEKHNTIDNSIEELNKTDKEIVKNVDNFEKKFEKYDGELSKIYTMFYNLSLHIAQLENKMLTNEKQHFKADIAEIQNSFMNFTQHMFQSQQISAANSSSQNEQHIRQVSNLVENHGARINALEDMLAESRSKGQNHYDHLSNTIGRVNQTVHKIRHGMKDHKSHASKNIEEIGSKMDEMEMMMSQYDYRIAKVEVHALNESLMSCQKTHSDLKQDTKLDEIVTDLDKFAERTAAQESQLGRLDGGLTRLYSVVDQQQTAMEGMMTQIEKALQIAPEVTAVQNEIGKFVNHLPRDCTELHPEAHYDNGYLIRPERSTRAAKTYCHFRDEAIFTVIQSRSDGSVSFARDWNDYKTGFGKTNREFWIGNDNLYLLTQQEKYVLRIDMWDVDDVYYWAEYKKFDVENEDSNYRLTIGDYKGNATDAMRYSNLMPFSTQDRDNDVSSTHCAKFYTAGWWYKHCHYSNLNGRYTVGVVWFNHDIDDWVQLKRTEMKLRRLTVDDMIEKMSDRDRNRPNSRENALYRNDEPRSVKRGSSLEQADEPVRQGTWYGQ